MKIREHYDVKFRAFGPPIDDAVLDDCERSLSVRLPPAYRTLLLTTNGGRPTPASFLMRGYAPSIGFLYSVNAADPKNDLAATCRRLRDAYGLPPHYLPIASIAGAEDCVLLLECDEEGSGRLYYWMDLREGFRPEDPDFVNVHPVYFRVDKLLRKLGPAKNREDVDGVFCRVYWSASNATTGAKTVELAVQAGYDINFVLSGYRHPVFAAMDGDAFNVVQRMAELGTRPDHVDPANGDMTVVERLRESLAWWRNRLREPETSDSIRKMAARRVKAIESALAVYSGTA